MGPVASPDILSQYPPTPRPQPGHFYGGGIRQLISQVLGVAAILGLVLPSALSACWILKMFGLLRVSQSEEKIGSDIATHGEKAYEDIHAE